MTRKDGLVVSRERRLFVDESVVARSEKVRRRMRQLQKHEGNPILSGDRAWESQRAGERGSVIRDPETGEFRLWYSGTGGNPDDVRFRIVVAYAVSLDGIHWRKPDLGLYDYYGQTANNICRRPHLDESLDPWYIDGIAALHDPADPDPLRRYKMMTTQKKSQDEFNDRTRYPSGYYVAFSPDGLHWQEHPRCFFPMREGFSDTLGLMRDPRNRRYICHVKLATPEYGRGRFRRFEERKGEGYFAWDAGRREWVRCPCKRLRAVSVSKDFTHWSKPEFILPMASDEPAGTQIYDTNPFCYEDGYLGFADIYHPNENQNIDVRLIWSPDGTDWRWAFDRQPILPNGRDLGDWDFGCHCMTKNPPIRMGDELWFYYWSTWYRHGAAGARFCPAPGGAGLGLAKLRLDGFVSLDAGRAQGRVLTVPIEFEHDALCVNANAQGGELRAQLLRRGRPVPGFGFEDCVPLRHDATRHVLRFKGGAIPKSKAPVRIEFALKNASLYSFWSEPAPPLPV